jgi:hypothetical protein
MATRKGIITDLGDELTVVRWMGLKADTSDVGEGVAVGRFPDRTVQAVGDFSGAGAVVIEGSNDGGVTWGALGEGVTLSDARLVLLFENPILIRPRASAGDASMEVDVHLAAVMKGA